MYYEATIKPANGGFGMYDCQNYDLGEGWEDEKDLITEIIHANNEVFLLGTDELPEGINDIRGRIYNEPQSVYVAIDRYGAAHYLGIIEI